MVRDLPPYAHIRGLKWAMDKAGVFFLLLICILVALVLSILMFEPGVETAPRDLPVTVPSN